MARVLAVDSVPWGDSGDDLGGVDVVRVAGSVVRSEAGVGTWEAVVVDDASVSVRELASFTAAVDAPVVFVDRAPAVERAVAAYDGGVRRYVDGTTPVAGVVVTGSVSRLADAGGRPGDAAAALVETVSEAAYILDSSGRFAAVNEAYASLVGVDRERLIGMSAADVVGRSPVAAVEAELDAASPVADVEVTIRAGDREIPVAVHVRSYELPCGAEGRVGVIEELGDRDHIEQELSSVMGRVTDAFFALDTDWRFTYLNDTAAEALERDREELLGSTVWEEFEPAVGTTFQEEYERAMETQESVTFVEYYPPLDAWFDVTAYPSETGLSVYFRDVTEEWQMREDLARERTLTERIVETSPVGILVYSESGAVEIGNERASELLGRPVAEVPSLRASDRELDVVDETGERLPREAYPVTEVLESGEPVFDRVVGVDLDGDGRRWLSVNAALLESGHEDEERRVVATFRDVTERQEQAERLNALNESLRDLLGAESRPAVCRIAVEAASESLLFTSPGVALYDDGQPALDLLAGSPSDYPDSLYGGEESAAWAAYTSDAPVATEKGIAVPVSGYGVFLTTNSRDDADVNLASAFAAYVTAALDRVERERSLREQRDALAAQNEVLERAERVNTIVRQVVQQLTTADSRAEIEQGVCMELAAVEPYQLAWVGHVDPADGVTPAASAGVGREYLDGNAFEDAEALDAVVDAGEVLMVSDLASDPPLPEWRAAATRQGFRSCCFTPVRTGGSTIGVLAVYAGTVNAFSETEVSVLEELGSVVGYAIEALQRKRALAGGESVEVTYEIANPTDAFLAFAVAAGSSFAFNGSVQGERGRLRSFVDVAASAVESAGAEMADAASVVSVDRVGTVEEGVVRLSVTFADDSVFDSLLDAGVVVTDVTPVGPGRVRVTTQSPPAVDVSSVTARIRDREADVSLVSRRERERPVGADADAALPSAFSEQLTSRQREVVETAFRAGYFDQPKRVTGRELAEILDVSQPTVNRHIRSAERALFELAFEE